MEVEKIMDWLLVLLLYGDAGTPNENGVGRYGTSAAQTIGSFETLELCKFAGQQMKMALYGIEGRDVISMCLARTERAGEVPPLER